MNVKELYKRFQNGESATKLSVAVGINRETLIQKFIKECGYVRKQANVRKATIAHDILEQAYLMYIEENLSLTHIAGIFNVNRKKLSKELVSNYNIQIRKDGKKDVDESAFSKITHDSAYWLGIMLTDGYVDGANGFELSLKDKEHVEYFKSFLKSKHKLQEKKISCNDKECFAYRLSIKNTQITNDLKQLNCTNCKSFTVRLPQIEEEYMPSLIRGIFDGDGCLSVSGTRKQLSFCSASLDFLNDIASYLTSQGIKVNKTTKSRNLYVLNISVKKDNLCSFFNLLYKDSKKNNRLQRKYEKYKTILPS